MDDLSPDLNIVIIWASFQSAGNILSLSDLLKNQLIELINEICMALDNRELICLIFCDASKALDRVWLRGLLLKLERYGIKGNLLQWLGISARNRIFYYYLLFSG
jgi:hypothetical protein